MHLHSSTYNPKPHFCLRNDPTINRYSTRNRRAWNNDNPFVLTDVNREFSYSIVASIPNNKKCSSNKETSLTTTTTTTLTATTNCAHNKAILTMKTYSIFQGSLNLIQM